MSQSRRAFLRAGAAAGALSSACSQSQPGTGEETAPAAQLALADYQPKSMLVVEENLVSSARYPAIDMHTHVSSVFRRTPGPDDPLQGTAAERLDQISQWMDELNLQTLVNLTGGTGEQLQQTVTEMVQQHPGQLITCTVPTYGRLNEQGYPEWQAEELARAKEQGAIGLKISKTLGLYLREGGFRDSEREADQRSPLVKIDDPRFDPMWDAAGQLGFAVYIHVADPDAFFIPTNRFNERWEELGNHPDWSFYGQDFPPKAELLAAPQPGHRAASEHHLHRSPWWRIVRRISTRSHRWLDTHPNLHVEIGARPGRARAASPRRARKFFEGLRGSRLVRDRRIPERIVRTAARPGARDVPPLFSIPRDPRRVLRLLARTHSAARPLEDLRHRPSRRDPQEGVPRQCCADSRTAVGVDPAPVSNHGVQPGHDQRAAGRLASVRPTSWNDVPGQPVFPCSARRS